MKKSLALILGLCILLSACTAGNGSEIIGDPTTTPPTLSQTTATTAPAETGGTDETAEPSKLDGTLPSESSELTEATHPAATVPSNMEDTELPKQTEPNETEPPVNPSQPTTPPETLPEETKPYSAVPSATEPSVTESPTTVPLETTFPATEPPAVEENPPLDCQEAMDIGNTHGAASYGWVVDPALNENNAGFHFGSWVFPQDGQERLNAEAIGQVDFLYREMKRLHPELDLSGIRFRVHAFICSGGTYEVRVYYA